MKEIREKGGLKCLTGKNSGKINGKNDNKSPEKKGPDSFLQNLEEALKRTRLAKGESTEEEDGFNENDEDKSQWAV